MPNAPECTRPDIGVVFDGDDTLWQTEILYDDARSRAREIVHAEGLDGAAWEELQRRIDVENVAVHGYSAARFPLSCVEAYDRLSVISGRPVDVRVAERIREAARQVFVRVPPLVEGVHRTLGKLRSRGVKLALLTKGDAAIQRRRVHQSGLAQYFDVVQIVDDKTVDVIVMTASRLGLAPSSCWMVGNSLRSDIIPAVEAGLNAIWIAAHVWEHERSHDHLVDDRMIRASGLSDVPTLILG